MISLWNLDLLVDARRLLKLEPGVKNVLLRHIDNALERHIAQMTHVIVMEAHDTDRDLLREICYSPLESDGARFPAADFVASFDSIDWSDDGAWTIVHCVGDSGFAYLIVVPDSDDEIDPALLNLCRAHAPH